MKEKLQKAEERRQKSSLGSDEIVFVSEWNVWVPNKVVLYLYAKIYEQQQQN